MRFSQLDIIGQEQERIAERDELPTMPLYYRIFYRLITPSNPNCYFTFIASQHLEMRAVLFCEDIAEEIEKTFTVGDLAAILLTDFLEYVKQVNDIHDVYKRLATRDLSPAHIRPYYTEDIYKGVLHEECRGYKAIKVRIKHKTALRIELILRDMKEVYADHPFTLEAVLEIIFSDFIDDYRRGLIKNPIEKITQYID